MELMKNENTQLGFKWGDIEIIRHWEYEDGFAVMKIKRANRTHLLRITPDGDIEVTEE